MTLPFDPTKLGTKPEFVKYPRIPYLEHCSDILGRQVYTFEKIDGSLSQVRRTDQGILGGSKANYITGSTKRPSWSGKFLEWMHSNSSLYNLKPGLIMFGEWLEPVTLHYDSDCLDKFYFIDLAILDEHGKTKFFDYDEAVDYLAQWDITDVEILPPIAKQFIDQGMIKNILNYRKSALRSVNADKEKRLLEGIIDDDTSPFQSSDDIKAHELGVEIEGVVLKNYSLQTFAKCLHPLYSEIRLQEKTLEDTYINPIRVTKAKRRLADQGNIHFNLNDLTAEIVRDIYEESGITFLRDAVEGTLRIHNDIYHINDLK